MKTNYKMALALVAGAAIGGAAIQGLHAQAKTPAYVVAEVDVTNQDAFVKEFVPLAVKALGEGGSGYKAIARLFDSLDQAVAAYNSAAYKEARKIGDQYATFRIYAVEGLSQ